MSEVILWLSCHRVCGQRPSRDGRDRQGVHSGSPEPGQTRKHHRVGWEGTGIYKQNNETKQL